MANPMPHGSGQQGHTLVMLLVVLAVFSWGASVTGPMWAEASRRDKEQELIKVGVLYAEAIERYYQSSPGSTKSYPSSLQDLLHDSRFVGTKRYLPRLYGDPVSAGRAWGVIRDANKQIRGVYSLSADEPVARESVTVSARRGGVVVLPPGQHYSDWKFSLSVGKDG